MSSDESPGLTDQKRAEVAAFLRAAWCTPRAAREAMTEAAETTVVRRDE